MTVTDERLAAEARGRALAAVERHRGRISITAALAVSIGGLILVAVLAVLAIGIWSGASNTLILLRENVELAVASAQARIEQHLSPAESQVRFVADAIERGDLDPADPDALGKFLVAASAAAPQVTTLAFFADNLQGTGANRDAKTGRVSIERKDYSGDEVVRAGMQVARERQDAYWGPPVWRPFLQQTILNLRQPVRRGDRFLGVVVAAVSVLQMSEYLAELKSSIGNNAFILYDRHYVLAHAFLNNDYPGLSEDHPLPLLSEFGDPVLAAIWQSDRRQPSRVLEGTTLEGHVLEIFNEDYIFFYRKLIGYSDKPWLIGAYFRTEDVNDAMVRLSWAALAGVVALALALVAALLLGRRIARPMRRLSEAANQIRTLEFRKIEALPGSVIRELDEQAGAFNAMLGGLKWFETYVPKRLVEQLMREDEAEGVVSRERQLAVMFTDITGFSTLSEGRPAAEIADFLNHHFALVAGCIEAEGGTVDKFIGDAVMAFWGAPEKQKNRAERACRAALAIGRAIHADNKKRRAAGEPPVHLRVGIHSGPVTVGNIGAPGRLNYTIVGDAANVAQRLELLCKEVSGNDPEVAILISEATAAELGPEFKPVPVGAYQLRGRQGKTQVFWLEAA